MARIGRTIADLSALRNEWTMRMASAAEGLGPETGRLTETDDFGSNPGQLRMLSFVPEDLSDSPALVVVLHGCTQTAAGYDAGAGWSTLAGRYGFALLLPEQRAINNPKTCFNWFQPGDIERDRGEALSIRQMVERMIRDHGIDRRRVFVTGLSAGGAMTSVMLATYPEVFAGGAIVAGLPYGAAASVSEAFQSMFRGRMRSAAEWGALVRAASPHEGPWPKISVWHGSADETVKPMNGREIVKQWIDVHGLPSRPTRREIVDGYPRRVWCDAQGEEIVEEYTITGMAHGTPLATGGEDDVGSAGPFLLDVGISSSYHIAKFWGLTDSAAATAEAPVRTSPAPRATPALPAYRLLPGESSGGRDAGATGRAADSFDIEGVIHKALRAAGLMK